MRGIKECPFSGVSKSGRVWRKVPESDAGSVGPAACLSGHSDFCACLTLPASLSGTFLQTLPDLVTPLKGHSLAPCSCSAMRSAPSERFGY